MRPNDDAASRLPANFSAIVHVPTTDVRTMTEGGQDISSADGVTFPRIEGPCALLRVQSGAFQFASS